MTQKIKAVYRSSKIAIRQRLNRRLVFETAAFVVFIFVMYLLLDRLSGFIQSKQVKDAILQAGPTGLIIFSLVYVVTVIVAPIPGFQFEVMAIGLFGVWQTVVLTYFLALLTCSVDFYISRKFGRHILVRVIGKRGLERVDGYSKNLGAEVLIISRLFEGHLFKWISYAAGLTRIPFKKYISITVWASIPYNLVILFFGSRIHDLGKLFVTLSLVNYVLIAIPFLYFLIKRTANKRKASAKLAAN